MKITKYMQSTFSVEMGEKKILIDPGKYNFLEGKLKRDYFNYFGIDILLVTHSHGDHFEPEIVKSIYEHSKPIIIAQYDVHKTLSDMGIYSECMKAGEKKKIDSITLEAIFATHKVDTIGFVIDDGENRVYHPGDTLYFDGKKPNVDLLFIPIGGRGNVMGPDSASTFTREVNPNVVIPMHYDGPKEYILPDEFVAKMNGSDSIVKVLDFNEEYIYTSNK